MAALDGEEERQEIRFLLTKAVQILSSCFFQLQVLKNLDLTEQGDLTAGITYLHTQGTTLPCHPTAWATERDWNCNWQGAGLPH